MAEYGDNRPKSTPTWLQSLSRRQFLGSAAALGAGALLGRASWALGQSEPSALVPPGLAGASAQSRVVVARSDRVTIGLQVRAKFLMEMIDEAVIRLSGAGDLRSAWGRYVTPGQKILLKFAQPIGTLGSEPAMLAALLRSLEGAGHQRGDIMVADGPPSVFAEGALPAAEGWSERTVTVLQREEPLRKYLDGIDSIINVPCLMHDNRIGVSCSLANTSLNLIRRPSLFDAQLHDAIAALNAVPEIRGRIRLTLVNAVIGGYDKGPGVDAGCLASDRSVWASTDDVALDRLALEWVQRQRRENHLPPLSLGGAWPAYINLAAERGLGQGDLRRIRREVVSL